MIYFLLVIYVFLFGWWVKSSSVFDIKGLSRPFIGAIFVSKIIAGLVYGSIHHSYFHGGDTFLFLSEANLISSTFFSYPTYYLGSLFGFDVAIPNATVYTYPISAIFWKDLGSYILVHVHSVLNIFALGNYALHIFFIAIVGLFASLNFYKVFDKILNLPKSILIIACFFMPSLTFWTSGLHKDVYVYFGLSLFILALLEFQEQKRPIFKLLSAILIIGLARHYLLALLVPATIAYLFTLQYSKRVWTVYVSVYSIAATFVVLFSKFIIGIEIFELLANQQAAFLAEVGNSRISNMEPFEPSFLGLLSMLPMASLNVLGRPLIWECTDFLQILASIEIMCFLSLALFTFMMRKQSVERPNPLLHLMVAYALSNLLLIGLLVANVGTIARYRAIALGILSALMTHILDFYAIGFRKKNHSVPNTTKTVPLQKQSKGSNSQKASIVQ